MEEVTEPKLTVQATIFPLASVENSNSLRNAGLMLLSEIVCTPSEKWKDVGLTELSVRLLASALGRTRLPLTKSAVV